MDKSLNDSDSDQPFITWTKNTRRIRLSDKPDNSHNTHNTQKKLLCHNIINHGKCNYGSKCSYAHNLSEQNMDLIRSRAYDIIKNKTQVTLDLSEDHEMAKTFIQLTKLCAACAKNKCSGGYNCKFGTCHQNYQVCYDDLKYGNCFNKDCKKVHLTKFGIKPVEKHVRQITPPINTKKFDLKPTLLTSDFFCADQQQLSDDSDSESSVDEIRKYLNEDVNECDESIFIK